MIEIILAFYILFTSAKKIIKLKEELPKKGRVAYKLLPLENKKQVDEIIDDLLELTEYKKEYDKYKSTSRKLANLYTTQQEALDKSEEKAINDLKKRLANKLLSKIKTIDYEQYKYGQKMYLKNQLRYKVSNLIVDLFREVSRNEQAQNNKFLKHKGELSKQTRIELAKKMESSSHMNWGIEGGDND